MKTKYILILCFSFFTLNVSFLKAQQGSFLWGENGIGSDGELWSITTDGYGNCVYMGVFIDTLQLGSNTLIQKGNNAEFDIFLVKSDWNGNILWAKQTEAYGQSNVESWSVSADGAGNSYIAANFQDTEEVGNNILINAKRSCCNIISFIAKYDPNGNVKWAKCDVPANGSGESIVNSISTDRDGNSYMTGGFQDTVYFGSQKITTPNIQSATWNTL